MFVCENSGEYKAYVHESPVGNTIECLIKTEDGFILATENAFYVYANSNQDPRVPLRQVGERSTIAMSMSEAVPS
jgi:hypothetical protein